MSDLGIVFLVLLVGRVCYLWGKESATPEPPLSEGQRVDRWWKSDEGRAFTRQVSKDTAAMKQAAKKREAQA